MMQTGIDQLPQGQIQADRFQQANPEDFGAETGQAIENAGRGVESYGADQQEVAQDKAQIWGIRAGADAALAATQMQIQMQQDPNFSKKYGEDGNGYTKAFEQKYQDYTDNVMGQAPDAETQRYLSQQLTEVGKTAMRDAMGTQASIGATWAKNNIQQTLDAYGRAAAANPQHYGEYLSQMQLAVDKTPYLSADDRIKLATETKQNMAEGAAMGWARDNPEAALGALRPDTLAQFRPTPRVEAALANGQNIQLPNNTGGDTVKPYDAAHMADIINQVKTPNAQLDPIFDKIGKAYGIDPQELKLRTAVESGLNANAVGPQTSSGQAKGLAQLTDAKAKELGVTNPFDPVQSITAMAQVISNCAKTSGGDTSKIDMTYYGGNNTAAWGSNTKQYAENLNCVRQSLHGDTGANPASFQDVLNSAINGGSREPVKQNGVPDFFNDLTWEKQYSTIMAARQGVEFNQTRQIQMQTYAKQQQELMARKFMSDSFDAVANKKMNPQDIVSNPNLSFEDKKNMLDALHSDVMGQGKDDAGAVNSAFAAIHAPADDPNRITSESQIWGMIGHGISVNTAKELRDELQKRGTPQGEMENKQLSDFLAAGKSQISPSTMFSLPDPLKERNYADFSYAVRNAIKNRPEGVSVMDMMNKNSKNYVGYLIDNFSRTPDQVNRDYANALTPKGATPAGGPPSGMTNGKAPPPVITGAQDAAYKSLKSGEAFVTPDGVTRIKP